METGSGSGSRVSPLAGGHVSGIVTMATLLGTGCASLPVLTPEGPAAQQLETLWWQLFWATIIPAGVVIALLCVAVRRGYAAGQGGTGQRPGQAGSESPPLPEDAAQRERSIILWAGGAGPAVIIIGLVFASYHAGREVAVPPAPPALTIAVTGHQFWWEVRYPEHDVVTANELHIPVGQPVRIEAYSADVIHSFWVPQLHGKIDMIPGHPNALWLQADRPGVYRGQCAEFCGIQHALMAFLVIAEPADQFAAWLGQQRSAAAAPPGAAAHRGQAVFAETGCHLCHVVRDDFPPGAMGMVGPDLTHVASRRTLGAVATVNDRAALRQWVLDPHVRKPGTRMPATPLATADLDALVAYLETLR